MEVVPSIGCAGSRRGKGTVSGRSPRASIAVMVPGRRANVLPPRGVMLPPTSRIGASLCLLAACTEQRCASALHPSNSSPSANPPSKVLGDDGFELHDVPRKDLSDRVTIRVTPHGNGRLELDPYPFDVDPLPVVLPARVAQLPADKPAHLQSWWNAAEPQPLHFTLCHAKS